RVQRERLAVAQDADFDRGAGRAEAFEIVQLLIARDRLAGERDDHVARFQAGRFGWRSRAYARDDRAARDVAEAEHVRELGRHVLRVDAERAALDLAELDQL